MLRNDAKEEFITATVSYSPLVRQYDQNAWDFVPYAGKEQAALKQILAIRERIYRQGFDSEEFEQANMGSSFTSAKIFWNCANGTFMSDGLAE